MNERDPTACQADLDFLHSYGNHKSASTDEGSTLAAALLHSDVKCERAIPLPVSYVNSIIGSELCPLGIAKQFTINHQGEIIEKNRACHDHTFSFVPSGQSLNHRTDKTALEPCHYGQALHRVLHHVHFLRLHHPSTPIVVSKTDLDAAYRRMHPIWSLAVMCISIIGSLAYLLLRLPFGAAAAPAEFCVASETVCDVANSLLEDESWDPSHTITPYHDLMPAPIISPSDTPYAIALPLDVEPPDGQLSLSKCDVHIDDIIAVGLFLPNLVARLLLAPAVAIHAIFRPLHPSEAGTRAPVLSLRKLQGDGALCEHKVVLGWLINTRSFTLSLPSDKFTAWAADIHKLVADGFTTLSHLATLIGRLNHAANILPFARHFIHRLRRMHDSHWSRRSKRFSQAQLADLTLWLDFLTYAKRGVSINLLTFRAPDVLCWSDACLTGMGGYTSSGLTWRWEIPLHLRGYLTLNTLEYAASIITIQIYLSSTPSTTPYPCLLSLLDSTSAIGWLHKSSFDEATHSVQATMSRYLAKLMMSAEACLYSQHIPGEHNTIADTLSRDFHIDSDTLSNLIVSHFQVHPCFAISSPPAETVSWLTSLMPSVSRLQELKPVHTPSATWLGVGGYYTYNSSSSSTIPSSTPSNLFNASIYSVPLCNQSATGPTPKVLQHSKQAHAERPLTMWHRSLKPLVAQTPAPTLPVTSPS